MTHSVPEINTMPPGLSPSNPARTQCQRSVVTGRSHGHLILPPTVIPSCPYYWQSCSGFSLLALLIWIVLNAACSYELGSHGLAR